ncbi:MAG: hypothetical protein IH851_02670 [Armatimonadetes bacterium]|nr:hypothetical protein [Armatimonadota bacterium]
MFRRIIPRDEAQDFPSLNAQLPEAPGVPVRSRTRAGPENAGATADRTLGRFDVEREKAFKEGFVDGYETGLRQGAEETKAQNRERLDRFSADLRAVVDRIERAMDLWYQKAEHGLSVLSADIAKKIVSRELETRPDAVLEIVREAVGRVRNAVSARVRVNPFDLPALEERKEDVCASAGSVSEIEMVGDDTLSRGSVIIESESGVVDATVESKLDHIIEGEAA